MSESNGNRRDTAGRFAVGNAGGPGRPRQEAERQYLDAKARDWLACVLGIEAARAASDDAGANVTKTVCVEDPSWYRYGRIIRRKSNARHQGAGAN